MLSSAPTAWPAPAPPADGVTAATPLGYCPSGVKGRVQALSRVQRQPLPCGATSGEARAHGRAGSWWLSWASSGRPPIPPQASLRPPQGFGETNFCEGSLPRDSRPGTPPLRARSPPAPKWQSRTLASAFVFPGKVVVCQGRDWCGVGGVGVVWQPFPVLTSLEPHTDLTQVLPRTATMSQGAAVDARPGAATPCLSSPFPMARHPGVCEAPHG